MTTRKTLPTHRRATPLVALLIVAGMAASGLPGVLATDSTAGTSNQAPAIGSTYYYASDPSSGSGATCKATGRITSFAPTSGSSTTVYACVEATDANGFEDVCDSAGTSTSEVHRFTVTDQFSNAISTGSHPRTNVALTCATGSGTAVALLGSFQMEYWRPAGTAAGTSAYRFVPEVSDVAGAAASSNPATFDYTDLTSIDSTTTGTINLGGSFTPGTTGTETSASIYNKGNVNFTIHVSSTSLTGGSRIQTIAASNLKWAASASVAYGSKTAMSGSSTSTGIAANREAADGTTAYPVYLQLAVPSASSQWVPADTWTGTVTFATG